MNRAAKQIPDHPFARQTDAVAPVDGESAIFPVAPTQGFLPPRFIVPVLDGDASPDFTTTPRYDLFMENDATGPATIPGFAQPVVAGDRLHLLAGVDDPQPMLNAELPDDRIFQQDHLEWRLLVDAAQPVDQLQIVLAADGRLWDNQGLAASGALRHETGHGHDAAGWRVHVNVALGAIGLDPARLPDAIYGHVSRIRFGAGFTDIASLAPIELGFDQADRFGQFVFQHRRHAAPAVALRSLRLDESAWRDGRAEASIALHLVADQARSGRLRVETSSRDRPGATQSIRTTLQPGDNSLSLVVPLTRPRFTRLRLWWDDAERAFELGATTLRAPVPAIDPDAVASVAGRPRLLAAPEMRQRILANRRHALLDNLYPRPGDKPQAKKDQPPDPVAVIHHAFGHWMVSDEDRWVVTATDAARELDEQTPRDFAFDDGGNGHLHTGMRMQKLGYAVDAFAPHPAGDKDVWQRLAGKYLRSYLHAIERREWAVTAIPNANAVCNGGGGVLALSCLGQVPEAEPALRAARRFIWRFLDYAQGVDGANTEGTQYWQYGLSNFLEFATALEQVLGHDDHLLSHPSIRNIANFPRLALCPDGGMHGVNDTIPQPCGTELSWFAARRFDDAFALWYGDHAQRWNTARRETGEPAPYMPRGLWALAHRPDVEPLVDAPELPTAIMAASIDYGALRSEPRMDARFYAGFGGARPPFTHHDAAGGVGAWHCHLHGERLLIDPGYHKAVATDHCVPLIDGVGPARPTGHSGKLSRCLDHGPVRELTIDVADAYPDAAARARRLLVMLEGGPVILLDDLVPTGPGDVIAQYQCGGRPEEIDDAPAAWRIVGDKAVMRIDLDAAGEVHLTFKPQRDLKDVHWGYNFADCEMHPVDAGYVADPAGPLVTVGQDATDAPAVAPIVTRTPGVIDVILGDARTLRFVETHEGWILAGPR